MLTLREFWIDGACADPRREVADQNDVIVGQQAPAQAAKVEPLDSGALALQRPVEEVEAVDVHDRAPSGDLSGHLDLLRLWRRSPVSVMVQNDQPLRFGFTAGLLMRTTSTAAPLGVR